MLQGTRIAQIYIRAEGPDDPRFGDEIDDEATDDYAYDGWLPLALSPRDEDGRQHATVIGDPWLTRPGGADTPPDPGPTPVRITATECSAELRERARLGLRYFVEETPEERGEPYDRNRIAEDIAERIKENAEALQNNRAVRTGFARADYVRIEITSGKAMRTTDSQAEPPPLDDPWKNTIQEFLCTRHRELVAHVDERLREHHAHLRTVVNAGLRLNAFSG